MNFMLSNSDICTRENTVLFGHTVLYMYTFISMQKSSSAQLSANSQEIIMLFNLLSD